MNREWQAKAFVDSEHVTVNHTQWTTGTNAATLSGAGLDWVRGRWFADPYVAGRLGSVPTLVASVPSARGWIQIGTRF